MIITSPSFADGDAIPNKFSCNGGNINPELQIQNVSSLAKSLVLVVHDPDAPLEGGFVHWLVWNISPTTLYIKDESVPPGAQEGANSSGNVGYMGPCPPPGPAHHYHFTLYALNTELDLLEGTDIHEVTQAMEGKIIEEADLVGVYGV